MKLSLRMNPRKKLSVTRSGLYAATFEGLPSMAIFFLLSNPFQTGYLLYLGASSIQIGIVLAIPALTNVVQIWVAFLMQRLENRRMAILILGSLHRIIWTATGLIPFLFAKALWVDIYMMMCITAFICNSACAVIFSSLIADMVPIQIRGRYFGIRGMILTGVGSLSLFIGGQILEALPGAAGFNFLYWICAICVVLNVIAYLFYPNLPFEKSREPDKVKQFLLPFRSVFFLKAMLFVSLWVFILGIAAPFFSFVMLDIMKVSYKWVSIVTMVQTVVMMVSLYLWGNLNAKYSTRTLLLWTFPLFALSCLLWGGLLFLPVLLVLFAVHILFGIGSGGFNILIFNFIIGDTPKSDRPMFIAVFSAMTGLSGFLGPLLGGILYKGLTNSPLWVQTYGISTSTGVILMLLALLLGPRIFRDPSHHSQN